MPADLLLDDQPADRFGPYHLEQLIGEGGFGSVWRADQHEPIRRKVALKILRPGMDTGEFLARFEQERQALALMEHPNIARIYDAGASPARRPYLVMELVSGAPITQYCDEHRLSIRGRLRLFIDVCGAIQHAHQKGVVHRDLKPSNILVSCGEDGKPVPKIIDFGIAKALEGPLTDRTLYTQFDRIIGTPAYMSPEQAEANAADIDPRSDIYSLGVLLYELLVGRPPFESADLLLAGPEGMRQLIRERGPVKPSTRLKSLPENVLITTAARQQTEGGKLIHSLRGDLDCIVMKCLEKERARRYDSAGELAMDLRRYLASEPIYAKPPSTVHRFRKSIRRNQFACLAILLVMVALALGISGVILVQYRANREYRERLYISEIGRAGHAWQAGRSAELGVFLDRCPISLRGWEWEFLNQQRDQWESTPVVETPGITAAELSADRRWVAVAASDTIRIRGFPSGPWLCEIPFAAAWPSRFALSPRGEQIATFSGTTGTLTLWRTRTAERLWEVTVTGASGAFDWSGDDQLFIWADRNGTIHFCDPATGDDQRVLSGPSNPTAVVLSPDDATLAVLTEGEDARLLDSATGAEKRTLRTPGGQFLNLKFSPDGRKVATCNQTRGGFKRDNRLWNLEADEEGSLDLNIGTDALSYDFSPDSRQLFIADATGMIRQWDLERRAEVDRFSAHVGVAHSVHWLGEGQLLSAGGDGLKAWQARRSGVVQLKGYPMSLRTLAFSPDSRWLAAAGVAPVIHIWDAAGARFAGAYHGHAQSALAVSFCPDGRVASAGGDQTVRLWDPGSLQTRWETSLAPAPLAYWIAFSPDGRRIYVPSKSDTLSVLDTATGDRLHQISGLGRTLDGLAVSPDGRLLALCHKEQVEKLSVRSADDLRELWQQPARLDRCVVFSPDGAWIATGDLDGAVSLWEVATEGRNRRLMRGHTATVTGVGFHPAGSRLVSCSADGHVKLWDLDAGAELLNLVVPGGAAAWHVAFSPDGKNIAAAGGDGIVTLWKIE